MEIDIKACTLELHSLRCRRFKFSYDGIYAFITLRKPSQILLINILSKIKRNSVIVTFDYKEFGYKHRQHFHSYRKELVDSGFLYYQGNDHYVNPVLVDYYTEQMKDHLYKEYGLSKKIIPNLGSR